MAKRKFNSVSAWCAQATGYIIHPADRKQVRQELEGHFEDRIDELKTTGMNYQEALRLAEEAMGDADEVGQLLRRIHTPYLSWAVTLSKYICIAALLVFIYRAAIPFGLSYTFSLSGSAARTEPKAAYDQLVEQYITDPLPLNTGLWFEKNGYHFTIEDAAYGRDGGSFMPEKHFILRISWKKPYPWSFKPALFQGLSIRDAFDNDYHGQLLYQNDDEAVMLISTRVVGTRDPNRLILSYDFGSIHEKYVLRGVSN